MQTLRNSSLQQKQQQQPLTLPAATAHKETFSKTRSRSASEHTDSTEGKITLLFKMCIVTEDTCKQMRPAVFRHPRLNGLSKIHKEDVTLIPTVSKIGAPTYEFPKYLAGDLGHFTVKFGTTWEKLLPALPDIEISTSTTRSNG
jgi:hypothetical protein